MDRRVFPILLLAVFLAFGAVQFSKWQPVRDRVKEVAQEIKEVVQKEPDPFSVPAQTARAIHFQCPEVNLNERKSRKLPPLTGLAGMNVVK